MLIRHLQNLRRLLYLVTHLYYRRHFTVNLQTMAASGITISSVIVHIKNCLKNSRLNYFAFYCVAEGVPALIVMFDSGD